MIAGILERRKNMNNLYNLTGDFVKLFDRFDEIDNYEPDWDENGNPIDSEGNIIGDVAALKEAMLTAWFDTLDGIEEAFEDKAVNVAIAVKNMRAEAEQLKAEKLRLAKRQTQKERAAERLEQYLLTSMQAIGREKIDKPQAVIRVKKNPESTIIDNEKSFIEWAEANGYNDLLKYKDPDIKKKEVKDLLKRNVELPFVHLERKTKIDIK